MISLRGDLAIHLDHLIYGKKCQEVALDSSTSVRHWPSRTFEMSLII